MFELGTIYEPIAGSDADDARLLEEHTVRMGRDRHWWGSDWIAIVVDLINGSNSLLLWSAVCVQQSIVFHVWGPGPNAAISRILLAGCYKRFVSRSPSYIFHSPSLLILQKKKESRVFSFVFVLFLFFFSVFILYRQRARAHVTAATLLLFYRNEKEKREENIFFFFFEIFFSPFLLPNW